MPIKVDCQSCGHRYQVGDNMAGKKVKCKTCGAVISIPNEGDEFEFGAIDVDAPAAAPAPQPQRAAPKASRPPVVQQEERYDGDEDDRPAAECAPAYTFAGAQAIETALPFVLAAVGLGWMVFQALRNDDAAHGWVGPFRAAMYVLAYLALVFPLALVGVRAAGKKAYFAMPCNYRWKTFAAFSLPAALAAIFTLLSPSFGMLAVGVLFGLVLALAAFVFLFNLRPQQMGAAAGIVSGYVLVGAALAVGLLVAMNYLVLAALSFGKTAHLYPGSPMGPQFAWNAPVPPADPVKTKKAVAADDTTDPATTEPTTQPTTQAIVDATTKPATTNIAIAPVPDTQPATKPVEVITEVKPSGSPFLATAPTALELGAIQDAFFTGPGGSGTVLAMTAHAEFGDAFEVWNVAGGAWTKTVAFNAQPKSSDRGGIVLNPKGTAMARMVEFPHLYVEVRPLTAADAADPTKVKKVEPDAPRGSNFELAGLTLAGHALVVGQAADPFLDVLDSLIPPNGPASQRNGQNILLGGLPAGTRCNLALAADPRYVATVRHTNATPSTPPGNALVINGLLGNRAVFKFSMTNLPPNGPVSVNGLTFSPDGTKVALIYQENGNGLLEVYAVPGAKQLASHIFSGPAATAAGDFRGTALTWLADGSTFLINGRYLMNSDTFEEMGDLGIVGVRDVHVVDRETLLLLTRESGKPQVWVAKLNPAKFHTAPTTRPAAGHSVANTTVPLMQH